MFCDAGLFTGRVSQATVINRSHTGVNAHLGRDTVGVETFHLIDIRNINTVEIRNLNSVATLG
ncbi:hypothetical protein D3C79_1032380 [compost metagenome]